MRLSSLLTLAAAGLTFLTVSAQDCWSSSRITCRNAFANKTAAHNAITAACDAMPSCAPGTTVTGKVPGYTATLRLGTACAGVNPWTKDACVALFEGKLYPQCKTNESLPYQEFPPKPWPPVAPVDFPLASKLSTCDDSWLSFNVGG
ncbi:uncharacterized protein CC84DRAFT_1223094 [Paraphaeosphaeria sporulosa]|uniref:Uncharacterized protein n=1 Tax=Paraphaeosphaeria sporulosa TaxID=1460663 RepID=A0A177BXJ0_9PLEO|nr:uncharacterized protein CC84DRAFT_1223094 [Paraphaeosphaeria sporulosa]OAF99421.1 hypothetical protein CC84DRAFT_1223094 [Paraphaeosphaeria sporulosa]